MTGRLGPPFPVLDGEYRNNSDIHRQERGRSLARRDFLRRTLQAAGLGVAIHPMVRGLGGFVRGVLPPDLIELDDLTLVARVAAPRIISRAEWGADEGLKRDTAEFAPVSKLIVHHTVTSNDDSDPAATVRAIHRHHVLGNGWNDIGYNFLVDQQGRIYEGRSARNGRSDGEDGAGNSVVGAHAAGYNSGSIGVALLGSFVGQRPTQAAIEGLIQILAWKADAHLIDPLGAAAANGATFENLTGHKRVGQTSCPGEVFDMLPAIRRSVALRIASGFIGYRVLASDGAIGHYGGAAPAGSDFAGRNIPARPVGISAVPDSQGFRVLDEAGGVHTFNDASYHGSIPELRRRGRHIPRVRVVQLESTVSGRGYWIADSDGGVFTFGDARFRGSLPLLRNQGQRIGRTQIVDLVRTPSGEGYWLVDVGGGVFTFGDARFRGSIPWLRERGQRIGRADIVSMAATSTGAGYWLLDSAGGVFTFGDARFRGSLPSIGVGGRAGRAVALVAAADDNGYLIFTEDGSVYTFGDVPFYGRLTGRRAIGAAPVVRS